MSDAQTDTSAPVGSVADIVSRMRSVLPYAWFPAAAAAGTVSEAPVLDSVLAGIASGWSYCFSLLSFVQSQARLATVNGSFLDLFAVDFFGNSLRRRALETDESFRSRLSSSLLMPRATRAALVDTVTRLVGVAPAVFEPRRGGDTGALGVAGLGYGSASPFQFLLTVDANGGPIRRESEASYLDAEGRLRIAPRHAARPVYSGMSWASFLIEAAGRNLLKDSVGFAGWSAFIPGGGVSWAVTQNPTIAIWAGMPTLDVQVLGAGLLQGPSVGVFVGDQTVTASVWIRISSGHTLTDLHLQLGNLAVNIAAQADLGVIDRWQRLVVTMQGVPGLARTVTAQLLGTSTGAMPDPVVTQCWQIEPGQTATSFIPSAGQIGIRDADRVVGDISSDETVTLNQTDIAEAIARTIPAGSVAWLHLQHTQ